MIVEFSREGPIGYITLNRPPVNSYDLALMREFDAAILRAEHDPAARVVIVRSAIDGIFSAGADIRAFHQNTPEENLRMVRLAHQVFARMANIRKVFIAQVNGHALGGGLEIALACDLRFAADGDYKIGLPEVTLGLLPGNGGTQRLPRLIGWSRALDLMMTGRTVSPAEAYRLGMFDRLFPANVLAQETLNYANLLAASAFQAVVAIKIAVRSGIDKPLAEALSLEQELLAPLFHTEDAREGISAFIEKRKPTFKGR
jgi:enoyl-CoA hydratase/carnithine racemase